MLLIGGFLLGVAASLLVWLLLMQFGGRTKVAFSPVIERRVLPDGQRFVLPIKLAGRRRSISGVVVSAELRVPDDATGGNDAPVSVVPASLAFERASKLPADRVLCTLALSADDDATLSANPNACVVVEVRTVAGIASTHRAFSRSFTARDIIVSEIDLRSNAEQRTNNEIGSAPARHRRWLVSDDAERDLTALGETDVKLEASTQLRAAPDTCPACGASEVMWGSDFLQTKQRSEIHGLVWHDTKWMANSYICRACWAGWIEPDDPAPITWVRPYWRV